MRLIFEQRYRKKILRTIQKLFMDSSLPRPAVFRPGRKRELPQEPQSPLPGRHCRALFRHGVICALSQTISSKCAETGITNHLTSSSGMSGKCSSSCPCLPGTAALRMPQMLPWKEGKLQICVKFWTGLKKEEN